MSDLPPTLITKLASERSSSDLALSTSDLPTATAAARSYAQRRLLASTPRALTTIEALLDSGDPKVRLSAASRITDLSPATRVDTLSPLASPGLSPEAITALLDGLRPFISAIAQCSSPPILTTFTKEIPNVD